MRTFFGNLRIKKKEEAPPCTDDTVLMARTWSVCVHVQKFFLFWIRIFFREPLVYDSASLLFKLSAVFLVLMWSCPRLSISPQSLVGSSRKIRRHKCFMSLNFCYAAFFVCLEYVSISGFPCCLQHGRYSCSCAELQRVLCELSAAATVGVGGAARHHLVRAHPKGSLGRDQAD